MAWLNSLKDSVNNSIDKSKKRIAICESNSQTCFNSDFRQCRLCGCNMDAKTLLPKAECPNGLW